MNRRAFIKTVVALLPAAALAPLSLAAAAKSTFVTSAFARRIYFPCEPLLNHDEQFIQTRKFDVEEIAAIFRIPPELIDPRYA